MCIWYVLARRRELRNVWASEGQYLIGRDCLVHVFPVFGTTGVTDLHVLCRIRVIQKIVSEDDDRLR